MTKLTNALRGPTGEFEINRMLGAAGVAVYIVAAPAFVAWDMSRGQGFDLVAFCAAYPTGLGLAIGAIAGAVSLKDRNVATARLTNARADATGATP